MTMTRPLISKSFQLLPAALAVSLAPFASAQTALDPGISSAERIPGTIRDAGTFHVATGTWTRSIPSVASFGQLDNIYSNTAAAIYYYPAMGPVGAAALGQVIDEGVIPSTTNPSTFALGGATQNLNHVTGLDIGYCDFEVVAASAGWTFSFYESYAPCTFPPPAPVGTVTVSGLPSNGCWFLNLDLVGSSQDFTIAGDGGAGAFPTFGIGFEYSGTGTQDAGVFIAGDPADTDTGFAAGAPPTGSNTYYGEVGACGGGVGTGYQNVDFYWVEDTFSVGGLGAGSACYFFGGYVNGPACSGPGGTPYSGFFLEMSDSGVSALGTISQSSCVGASNNTGAPGVLDVVGSASTTANNAILRASGLPTNQMGLFIAGLAPAAPGAINSGNGYVCIDPSTLGGLGRFNGANQMKNSGPNGVFILDTNAGEWNLASIPTSSNSYAALSGLTSYFSAWHREQVGAGYNFTGAASVTWQ